VSDTIWVCGDDSAVVYVRLVKGRFHYTEHEELKLHAAGKNCIYTLFKTVEMLTRWGYATLGTIKTSKLAKRDDEERSISKVEATLKKCPEFEKLYEDFEVERLARRAQKFGSKPNKETAKSSVPAGKEEVKEASPKRQDEEKLLHDGISAEAPTSAKSQSTPEKADASGASASSGEAPPVGMELKKDKWWLKGVSGKELVHLEGVDDDEEPLIFM
jgi:hypothetical protein